MKFCEKCGNKLKDGFEFCDKCGAKVTKKEEKKKEEKEEKKIEKEEKKEVKEIKEVVKPVPVMYPVKRKTGKGKIVFLTILNILLLAATITFLVLWLVKPEGSCTNSNSSNSSGGTGTNTEKDPPAKVPLYVGQWEQNVEYKSGNTVTQRTYGMIDLMSNGNFEMIYYDKDDISNTKEQVKGTYEVDGDDITFSYTYNGKSRTKTAYFEDDKMCLNTDCSDYLVKDSYNNTIVIQNASSPSKIDYINYTQYENLQKNYEDAIVVIVREGCSWCEKYESVVEDISEEYTTPVYYYENDGKISISGTPTTIIIKNGYVVGSIEGYKDFSSVSDTLDDLGVK